MHFDRKTFWQEFRKDLDGTIEQEQVDGLEFLLARIEEDSDLWKDLRHIAYALATTMHETASSFQPVEEGYYLERYGAKRVKSFQKGLRYFPYFGRGFVQLTWLKNYTKATKEIRKQMPHLVKDFESTGAEFDLAKHPEQALDPLIAYAVMTLGMLQGWFTGKKLSDYINDDDKDYEDGRRIINGTDKAKQIAAKAEAFEKVLRRAARGLKDSEPAPASKPATTIAKGELPSDDSTAGQAPINQTGSTSTSSEITKKTEAETKDGTESVAVSTTVGQNVVIEKRVEEGWLSNKWKQVTGAFAAGGALDGVTDRAKEVQAFGLSETFWTRFFYVAIGALVIYLVADWWKHHSKIKEAREMDKLLVEANSTPTNFVQFAPTEYLQEYRNRGYKVITR